MSERSNSNSDDENSEQRRFALTLARTIAGIALDPHGYFELHYLSRIEKAATDADINVVVLQLLGWVVGPDVSDSERESLEHALSCAGLPSLASLTNQYLQ
jgi:hypothetical protein